MNESIYEVFGLNHIHTSTKQLRTILYATYETAYLNKVMKNQRHNLTEEQVNELLKLFQNL